MALAPLAGAVRAQAPAPIRLVVSYPPGGSNDIVARLLAPRLAELLGTNVYVENRPGANGTVGVDAVAKAAPDGSTLLVSSASPIAIAPHLLAKPPFDPVKDFIAINTVGQIAEAIAVGTETKASSLKELVALAKTREVTLSSSGNGGLPHLTIELLKTVSQGQFVHVPYKGAAPAVGDTLGGHVDGIVMDLPALIQQFRGGKLRPLAVTSAARVEFLPDVPTAAEQGLSGLQSMNWIGLFAPARTPAVTIARLNAALLKIVATPEFRKQLGDVAVSASSMASPAAFQKFVGEEVARWGKVAKDSGATMD